MKSRYSLASLVSLCAIALFMPSQGLSQPLQDVLDSLGYDYINVNEDETGIESFMVVPGETCYAQVLAENPIPWPEGPGTGGCVFGWYVGSKPDQVLTSLFDGADPGDEDYFTVEGGDTFGFFVAWPNSWPFYFWYTKPADNADDSDRAWVFATEVEGEYIIAWDDDGLADGDFDDLVVLVTGLTPAGEEPLPEPITIDICPDSDANPVNPITGPPVIPVAIFGSVDFDVADIDLSTLALDGDSPDTPGEPGAIADPAEVVDVNGDGVADLIVQFLNSEDGIVLGDVKGIVTGKTLDGVPITGEDDIKIVGRTKPKKPKEELKSK